MFLQQLNITLSSMQQSNKSSLNDSMQKREVEVQLQKMSYIKVKIIFHHNDKTTKSITYRCSFEETLIRLITSLRTELKLKQHESVFLYSQKRLIDLKQRICDLKMEPGTTAVIFQAATSDIF